MEAKTSFFVYFLYIYMGACVFFNGSKNLFFCLFRVHVYGRVCLFLWKRKPLFFLFSRFYFLWLDYCSYIYWLVYQMLCNVIMHVNCQVSVVRVGHHVPLTYFCLSLCSLCVQSNSHIRYKRYITIQCHQIILPTVKILWFLIISKPCSNVHKLYLNDLPKLRSVVQSFGLVIYFNNIFYSYIRINYIRFVRILI